MKLRSLVLVLILSSMGHAQYSLEVSNTGGARDAQGTNLFRAELMRNGSAVASFERTLPYDVPFPAAYVHPVTGTVVLSFIFDGFAEVYDNTGRKMWEQHFFKEMGPNYERTITVALGSTAVVFLTSDVTLPHATVRTYALNGAKQWEAELPFPMGYEVAMSEDEQTVIAGSYQYENGAVRQRTLILDGQGKENGSAEFLFRKAVFSPDGALIGMISNVEAAVIQRKDGSVMGRIGKQTAGVITDLLWEKGSLIIQESMVDRPLSGELFYRDPVLLRYSSALIEQHRVTLPQERYKQSTLSTDGQTLKISFDGKQKEVQFR